MGTPEILVTLNRRDSYQALGRFPTVLAAVRAARRYSRRLPWPESTDVEVVILRRGCTIAAVPTYVPITLGRRMYIRAASDWQAWQDTLSR